MLSHGRPSDAPCTRRRFWCEAAAHPPGGSTFPLGSKSAGSPRLALRWLRSRAADIADQLDPPAARPVRAWLADHTEHERALSHLAHGEPYTFTAYEDTTHYVLTARPTTPAPSRRHRA
ncbi:hypothetical protein [Streptomyces sp. JJ36]|uniref:hypothetical protein n=1 Tax=Streptomyces sp. JJ36 TaxID=2736645 RepID=UPI001F2DF45D|nr:hypothetical protein [Streptomyces sp. JJ36]MCF6525583.1 hypothetical protein [Streptomyces sp. JJ36]